MSDATLPTQYELTLQLIGTENQSLNVPLSFEPDRLTEVADIIARHTYAHFNSQPSTKDLISQENYAASLANIASGASYAIEDAHLYVVNDLARAGIIPLETIEEIRGGMAQIGLPTYEFFLTLNKNSRSNSPQQISYRIGDQAPPPMTYDADLTLSFTVTAKNFPAACVAIGRDAEEAPEVLSSAMIGASANSNHAERVAQLVASGFVDQTAADRALAALARNEVMLIMTNPETDRNLYPIFHVDASRLAELETALKDLVPINEGSIAGDPLNPRHVIRVRDKHGEVIDALEQSKGEGTQPGLISAEQASAIRTQMAGQWQQPITSASSIGPRTGRTQDR